MPQISLDEAFAAGTLLLPFCASSDRNDTNWVHLTDYRFNWGALSIRSADSHLLEIVDYLVRTDFVYATVKSTLGHFTHIRVYVIPADAPGQAVWLRTAKPAVLNARTDSLRIIFGHIDTSREAWEGSGASTSIVKSFFDCCQLESKTLHARTLSHIFQGLASPVIERARLDGNSAARIEALMQYDPAYDCIPGLRSSLYAYQGKVPF